MPKPSSIDKNKSSFRNGCRALILLAFVFVSATHAATSYNNNLVANGDANSDLSNWLVSSDPTGTINSIDEIMSKGLPPRSPSGGFFFDFFPDQALGNGTMTQAISISDFSTEIATGRVQALLSGEAFKLFKSGRAILRLQQLGISDNLLQQDSVDCIQESAWELDSVRASGLNINTKKLTVVLDFRTLGTEMGNIIDFDNIQLKLYRGPTLTTTAATSNTGTTATLGGNVSNTGDLSINGGGLVYSSTQTTPIRGGANVTDFPISGVGLGAFNGTLTGLVPNSTYYVRAYASNTAGSMYGGVYTLNTPAIVPNVTSNAVTGLSATATTLNATVNANNANTTVRFEYGTTTSYGTTANATPASVTGTANTAASLALTGLVPNTIYHYRAIGSNVAGTSNGADITFMTPVMKPTVSTNAATSIAATGATLNATVNANNANTTVSFEYGTTTSYGTTASAVPSSVIGTANTAASIALTGLTPNTTYHYRVKGVNVAGTTDGTDLTFTTSAIVPTATSNAASNITATGATLNATVNANNSNTTVRFEIGPTSSYGITVNATPLTVNGTANVATSFVLPNLTSNTTYYFRVKADNAAGTTYGAGMTFTTSAVLPSVTSTAATSITATGATVNATVNANNASTSVSFEYGTTTSYGTTVSAIPTSVTGTTITAASRALAGLTPNTTYHYRVKGENMAGIVNGSDLTFTTSGMAPTATSNAASSITATGATLNATVNANNSNTTISFDYGTTTSYGSTASATPALVTGTTNTAAISTLTGLIPNTTYHYRAKGVNAVGTTNGSDMTFTTSAVLPTVASNAATSITATGATVNATVNANNASTTVSFEYGTTTSYGTTVSATPASVTGTTNTAASSTLTGLIPNSTYHYRVIGSNIAGTVNGTDLTFTTPAVVATATSVAATSVSTTGATLNATVNANNTSTNVSFEYGTSTAYGTEVTFVPSAVNGTTVHALSQQLTGLAVGTTYHFRIKAVNSVGTSYGDDLTFTTLLPDPTLITEDASDIDSKAATIHASANANGNVIDVHFEYGVTDQYGTSVTPTQSTVTGNTNTAISYDLTGLIPNTTYHYCIVTGHMSGGDKTFTTAAAASVVTTGSATGDAVTGVTLKGSVNAQNSSTTVTFEYGIDLKYGSSIAADPSPVSGMSTQSVSALLKGLKSNTAYHYRVVAKNSAGTSYGEDAIFTTPDTDAPTVATVTVPTSKTYKTGDDLVFTVKYSEKVTVTGTPTISLVIGSTTLQASYKSGTGTNSLVFHYLLASGDSDKDGIKIATEISLNKGSIADAAGNKANLALGTNSTSGILVENTTTPIRATNDFKQKSALHIENGNLYVHVPSNVDHLQLEILDVNGRSVYNMPVGNHDFMMTIPAEASRGSIAMLSRQGRVLATQALGNITNK